MEKKQIGQYLLEEGFITEAQLNKCISLIEDERYIDYKLGDILVAEGFVELETLGKYLNEPVLDVKKMYKLIDVDIFDKMDIEYLLKKKFVPYSKNNAGILSICMVNIQSKNERSEIIQYLLTKKVITNHKLVAFHLSTMNMIEHAIDMVSRREEIEEASLTDEERESKSVEGLPEDERPRYYFNKMLVKAIKKDASDIHIEPYEDYVAIRYRIDGALTIKPVYKLPKKQYHQPLLAIIKTKAELNVAEKRMPQGGSINYVNEEENITADLRVSFLNTVSGEKSVIRILPKSENIKSIENISLTEEQKEKLLYLASKPKGMVLVTGPTGSGKSTTLYALLQHINTGERNIMTAEDPVEMYVEGIHQVQVNKAIDFTFDVILREFLRQDPDVLMVGEIRDTETAKIASQAAETGHLVFSTLHTNSGIETINRLDNMGIPKYLINASLTAVVAQRLVRKLCPYCKQHHKITTKQSMYINEKMQQSPQKIDKSFFEELYYTNNPKGCSKCEEGFKGRIAVYEILIFNDKLKNYVSSSNTIDVIEMLKVALDDGHELMYVDGLRKAREGIISLDELIKIVE